MKESPLPLEFQELLGKVHYVRERTRGKEWSSSCPQCGGEPHKTGQFPDRFRMWPKSKVGVPFGWCRACGYKWTSEKDYRPDPEKIEAWRRARLEYETQVKEQAEQAIAHLTDAHKWKSYYSWLCTDQIAASYWIEAGIRDEFWWNEWQLGYDPSHTFWYDDGGWREWVTPTATIPVRDITGRIINIKHRLLKPLPDGTKYRMEYKTNTEPIFIANLEKKNYDVTVLCEGDKKAAVTFLTIDSPNIQVYGLPKSPSEEMLKAVQTKRMVDILDPDIKNNDRKANLYKDVDYRVLRLPYKVDDMIQTANLSRDDVRGMIRQARKV